MTRPIFTIGDYVIIKGNHRIQQAYFDKNFPQGIFGKVIGGEGRYSIVRAHFKCVGKLTKSHIKVHYKNMEKL